MSGRAEMGRLIRELKKQGFVTERTGSGHWKVYFPGQGGFVILAFSPTGNAFHKSLKRLEAIGYKR